MIRSMSDPLFIISGVLFLSMAVLAAGRAREQPDRPGRYAAGLLLFALIQFVPVFFINTLVGAVAGDEQRAAGAIDAAILINLANNILRLSLLFLLLHRWSRLITKTIDRALLPVSFACLFLGIAGVAGLSFAGIAIAFFVAVRSDWCDRIGGGRRFVAFLGSFAAALFLLPIYQAPIALEPAVAGNVNGLFAISTFIDILDGASPFALRIARLTCAALVAILAVGTILWTMAIVTLYKLMVPRLRLRALRLKRRFTVTYSLIILLPGIFSLAAALVAIYMGVGAHKSSLARRWIDETIERDIDAAGILAKQVLGEEISGADRVAPPPGTTPSFSEDRRFVIRETDPGGAVAVSLPEDSLPDTIVANALFRSTRNDTAAGMLLADGRLYLACEVSVEGTDEVPRRVTVETYRVIDEPFLTAWEEDVWCGIELRTLPETVIRGSGITRGSSLQWTSSPVVVSGSPPAGSSGDTFLDKAREISRSFFPHGEWLHYDGEEERGAILLTLSTSLRSILGESFRQEAFVFMQGPALGVLLVVLFLFGTAMRIVVGTGRGIVSGLIEDLDDLYAGAERLGSGDLDHKVPVRGKDEVAGLSAAFNEMGENLKRHQRDLIEKERLEADLVMARQIQQRLLPQSPPHPERLDVAGVSIPSREVGGDLFYFLDLPGGLFGVAIGDVSGKSVPAALLMSNVLAALKMEALHESRAAKSLAHMNDLVADQVEPGRFVTFFYGVIDPLSGLMRYACAGHNPTLVVGAGGSERWLTEAGLPLGVLPGSDYAQAEERLDPGDVLVLYSDGVTEAERAPAERAGVTAGSEEEEDPVFFDEEGLLEAVRSSRAGTAAEILESVLEAVRRFTGGAPASDDLTLVVVKVADDPVSSGSGGPPPP